MDDCNATVWIDIMTFRPLRPGQKEREELRLNTVKAEDVDAMIAFWRPVLDKNTLWPRRSDRNDA